MSIRSFTLVGALALALTAPAVRLDAQGRAFPRNSQSYTAQAYNDGFRRGELVGEQDGRRGVFNLNNSSEYRNADYGYRTQYGDRNRYRADFRTGFEAGYRAAYDRNDRSRGRGYARGRTGNYGNNGNYGTYGNNGSYGNYGSGYGYDPASNNGYNDGYEEGVKDGRARHNNDPMAESRYRNGDRGYNSSYGTRDYYRNSYRRAFMQGYEQGYRETSNGYYR